jgi:hypothetical protein
MESQKIDLDKEMNLNRIKARVFIMLRKLPDLYDSNYESIVRQLVKDNFTAEKIERFEDHFILFSIGRPSVFDQLTGTN